MSGRAGRVVENSPHLWTDTDTRQTDSCRVEIWSQVLKSLLVEGASGFQHW